jgi:hypothetical protein
MNIWYIPHTTQTAFILLFHTKNNFHKEVKIRFRPLFPAISFQNILPPADKPEIYKQETIIFMGKEQSSKLFENNKFWE